MLNRFKPFLWYSKRLVEGDTGYIDDGIERFAFPVQRKLNYRFLSGELSLVSAGELKTGIITARCLRGHPDKYFEGDRLYIGEAPKNFDPIDPKAGFKIVSVLNMHNIVEIIAEKLI